MTNTNGHAVLEDLAATGLLSSEQLESVAAERKRSSGSIARLLIEVGVVSEEGLPAFLSAWKRLPLIDLAEYPIDAGAVATIPDPLARHHAMLPIAFDGDAIVIAVADPTNLILIDDARMATGRDVRLVVAAEAEIEEARHRMSNLDRRTEAMLNQTAPAAAAEPLQVETDNAPVVRAVQSMLTRAVHLRASDVHIEPQEDSVVVRYRIDGVLHEAMRLPSAHHPGLVSRIKVLAGLDIAERRLPQDGRLTVRVDDRPVDLRVATIPGAWGEDVILRVLDRGGKLLSLEALGFPESVRRGFEGAVRRPFGCVLVTGPTGAGKSTTLYATLQIVDDESKKIVTVEDPIEYRFQRLRQMQVHPAIGLTFARALRSILRADPDVVMVGEIRDSETATIAIHAALTGHIVLSTLHTNDAPTGPTRLVEMGVEPYLVASALECVLAQRLVRRLCTRCKVEDRVPEGVREEFGVTDPYMPIFRPGGCGHCAGTGYRGRLAVVELMVMSEQLKSLTMERRPSEELRAVALRQGMRPLRQAGIDFVKSGDTSLEELLRVLS